MKKSFKALVGASCAAALILSACADIADVEETDSKVQETFSESVSNLSRAASYASSSGLAGSMTSTTPTGSGLTGVKAQGWLNSAYIIWTGSPTSYTVTCDGAPVSSYLTRKIGSQWRCDIPGLAAGSHTIKVTSGSSYLSATVNVASHDRSGFAFYGNTVPGAYKADGTLKSGAVVLYINESTKDSVSLDVVTSSKGATTACTGLQNILNAFKKGYDNRPLCVRIIGRVTDFATMDNGDIMVSGSGATKLLSNGITIEGIGSDATAYGWGLRIKNAQYIEVANIGFMMVDSAEGDNVSLQQSCENVWVHNCDMFYGEAGGDADQKKGDGALDCKKSTYVTFSYNHFWDSGKCNLLGLSEGTTDGLYITYHHNWYDHSDSRHPRVRFYSAHVYNNYYDGNAKYGAGACLGSSVFMESNYFRNCKYPMMISMQGSDLYAGTSTKKTDNATFSKENGGMIKAYNNSFNGTYNFIPYGGSYSGADTKTDFDAYVVSSRYDTVPSSVASAAGSNKYNNFDTSSIMYSYTADSPANAMANVKKYAGRIEGGDFQYTFSSSADSSADMDNTLKSKLASYTGATTAYNTNTSSDSSESGSGSASESGSSSGSSSSSSGSGSSSGSSGSSSGSGSSSSGSGSSSGSSSSSGSTTAPASAVSLKGDNLTVGTLSSSTTSGSFTILATSAKTVKVSKNSLSYNSNSYKQAIDLGGGADGVKPTYRAIKFNAAAGSSITVVANAGSTRTLNLSDGSSVLKTASVTSAASVLNYTTTKSGTFYLYSSSSSLKIYEVYVSGSSSSSTSGSSSGSSSSGSTSNSSGSSSSGESSASTGSAISFKPTSLSAGSVTSNATYGSFQVLASSEKPVAIVNSSLSYNSNSYTKALDLKGGFAGTKPTYRAVKFDAASGATISVVATAGATRTLQLSDGSSVLKSVSVGTSATLLSYTTTKSGTYYVYSSGSAISIYEIYVSAAGSSSSSSGSSSSGSSSSGSSSGSSSSGSSSSGSSSSGSESSSGSTGSGSGLSNTGSTTQSGVGSRSRLTEITNKSQIKSYIYCQSASEITSALSKVAGGQAVVIKAGTYKFSSPITIASSNKGSSSAMKYVMAEPGSANKVIFDFSGEALSDSNRGIQIFGDYWHFFGINVTGAGDNGMYIGGSNNIVELCVFYANRDSGLQIAREKSSMSSMSDWPSNNLILNCTSYDNADPATGENADGFACKLTCGNGNVFDGCIAYCNCDDGWDLYAKEATGSIGVVTIRNCVAYNNGRLTTNSSYANGDMNGFKLGGSNGKVPTAHIVTNCLAVGNGHDGFTDNGNGGALNVSYCTSYGNAKVNFNFYRTNKGKFDHMLTLAPKSSDKYGTSSVASTISNSVYFTNSKYYYISSAASITNGQKDFSTTISAPSTTATSLACNSSVHTSYRNADGTIKLSGYTNSSYKGHSFGSQASSVMGISLK